LFKGWNEEPYSALGRRKVIYCQFRYTFIEKTMAIKTDFIFGIYIGCFIISLVLFTSAQESISANTCNPPCTGSEKCDSKGNCISSDDAKPAFRSLGYSFWKGFFIGDKRVVTREDKKELKAILSTCKDAMSEYNLATGIAVPGIIFCGVSFVFDAWSIIGSLSGKPNFTPLIYSLGAICLATPFLIVAGAKDKKATEIYNNQKCSGNTSNFKIDAKVFLNGFALTMEF